MTLEEIEQRARRHIDTLIAIYGKLPPPQGSGDGLAHDMAVAVLLMLPVVRAAESWCEFAANHPYGVRGDDDMEDAIDHMRAALAKEG